MVWEKNIREKFIILCKYIYPWALAQNALSVTAAPPRAPLTHLQGKLGQKLHLLGVSIGAGGVGNEGGGVQGCLRSRYTEN